MIPACNAVASPVKLPRDPPLTSVRAHARACAYARACARTWPRVHARMTGTRNEARGREALEAPHRAHASRSPGTKPMHPAAAYPAAEKETVPIAEGFAIGTVWRLASSSPETCLHGRGNRVITRRLDCNIGPDGCQPERTVFKRRSTLCGPHRPENQTTPTRLLRMKVDPMPRS